MRWRAYRLAGLMLVLLLMLAGTSRPPLAIQPADTVAPASAAYYLPLVTVPSTYAKIIRRVSTPQPYVAITVDDFYTADYRWRMATRLLDAANTANATLTLCPAGDALESYTRHAPDQAAEIKRLVAAGAYELLQILPIGLRVGGRPRPLYGGTSP